MRKWIIVATALAFLAVSAPALAESVTAKIDGKCRLKPAKLVIPAGKKAAGFKVDKLDSGRKCVVGGPTDGKGFGILDSQNKVVYSYSKYKNGAPVEKGGPLNAVTLPGGQYSVVVDGGNGAIVTLIYSIK